MASVIEDSLKEYQNFLNGEKADVDIVETTIPVKPEFNSTTIKDLRKKINVTQKGLANLIGVSTRTVESWEMDRTEPNRSSQKLLTLLTRDTSLVNELRLI
ncbi:MAG: type II toxin-antitoxin system MqsA family antitoxin [Limosilactobacillus sp.]|jgi:putative transcriptional regulator|uniref:helix-turn-helix domain-containing protein n=1 Tax=Limosilactobacillus sp. TaxID=2773925 RepID=UPI0025B7DA81|nr:type II toxin-antitoxin system MqsA family antitoxin [Limosilactobacillus sp.]MCI1974507.1 type II toxin-antitoxin system MqsA family antitoxin [Limosilactobacillus sp.]MCI2030640.1 type II toxin-antitoxin system MqsA family antitoxin [Limosilactobacillus sp.]